MKQLALPLVLALLLAAPIAWRLGSPTLEAEQMEQAVSELKQSGTPSGQSLSVTSYTLEEKTNVSATVAEMPRVPDTAELMRIRYADQEN